MNHKKIIITGGTGFIGQELVRYFGRTNDIVVLGRQSADTGRNSYSNQLLTTSDGYRVRYVKWDGKTVEPRWLKEMDGSDLLINLAGKSVNCRYHKKQKQEIMDSRVLATRVCGEAIRQCQHPPACWINGASTTIYRNEYERPNDESSGIISDRKKDNMPYSFFDGLREKKNRIITRLQYGKESSAYKEIDLDFSVQVCKAWEQAFLSQDTPHTRKILLRTAITLGAGGVITPYINLCRLGLGGKHGSGKQLFSWVHANDLCRMIDWLYDNGKEGVYNCAAPDAVTNEKLMKTIRHKTKTRFGLPAPVFLLEAGAFLIGTETELLLKSRWAFPGKALQEGFHFIYPTIEEAVGETIDTRRRGNKPGF